MLAAACPVLTSVRTAAPIGTVAMCSAVVSTTFSVPSISSNSQFRMCASATSSTTNETALDVAMKVNKLKRMHQAGQGQGKKEIEKLAWRELNTLSEAQIASAEGKAVALLLNSWAYFARFWERGKDGPFISEEETGEKKDE